MNDEGSISSLQLYIIGGLCCLVLSLGLGVILFPKEADLEVRTTRVDQALLDSSERAEPLSGKVEKAVHPWWEWAVERVIEDIGLDLK